MSEMSLEEKLCKNLEDSCIKAYRAGQQSMQDQLNNMETCYIQMKKERDELQGRIKDQIGTLKAASKSHVYNYREQNIMLSQADDLEKVLRGASD